VIAGLLAASGTLFIAFVLLALAAALVGPPRPRGPHPMFLGSKPRYRPFWHYSKGKAPR
jgi:hypothetical protein